MVFRRGILDALIMLILILYIYDATFNEVGKAMFVITPLIERNTKWSRFHLMFRIVAISQLWIQL